MIDETDQGADQNKDRDRKSDPVVIESLFLVDDKLVSGSFDGSCKIGKRDLSLVV